MTLSLNVVDLFCGAGGMSLGFKEAGFNVLYAVDFDQKAISTYRANLGEYAEVGDIFNLDVNDIEAKVGGGRSVDIVIGGPPCQGFSVQRRGPDKDERNNLVLEYARIVVEIKPKVFVMENVGGLLSKRGDDVLGKFKSILSEKGYSFYIKKIDASHFGVPQARKRVFFIGVSEESVTKEYVFPKPIEKYLKNPVTVMDSIFDIKDMNDDRIPNHRSDKLSDINMQRIRSIKQGQGRDSLPDHLQLACHKNNKSHRHLDTYGRMAWADLAPTITARFDSFSRGRFGHPENDRSITLREGARLQTFPDKFVFIGTKVEIARQIGNAVPPILAKEIAKSIRKLFL